MHCCLFVELMRRVTQAYILFTNNKKYYSLIVLQFLCHTYQLHLEPTKCRKKANLNRLVKPADLSQISPARSQLAKPADEEPQFGLGSTFYNQSINQSKIFKVA